MLTPEQQAHRLASRPKHPRIARPASARPWRQRWFGEAKRKQRRRHKRAILKREQARQLEMPVGLFTRWARSFTMLLNRKSRNRRRVGIQKASRKANW